MFQTFSSKIGIQGISFKRYWQVLSQKVWSGKMYHAGEFVQHPALIMAGSEILTAHDERISLPGCLSLAKSTGFKL